MSHGSTRSLYLVLSAPLPPHLAYFAGSAAVLGYKIAKYNKQLSANLSRVKRATAPAPAPA